MVALTVVCGCAKKTNSSEVTVPTAESEDAESTEVIEESIEITEEPVVAETVMYASAAEAEKAYMEQLTSSIVEGDEDILQIFTDDYDCDGSYEAFAFIGIHNENSEWEEYKGNIWYVDNDGAVMLEKIDLGVESPGEILDFSSRKYYMVYELYATARVSHIYSVRDGKAVPEAVSELGDLARVEGDNCTISVSAYDTIYDPTMDTMLGHSWKKYYFHYSATEDCIVEYLGDSIDSNKAEELCPEGLFEEMEAEGYEIGTIYLRENGIVNINYSCKAEDGTITYGNINYDTVNGCYIPAWDSEITDWKDSDFGGTYISAITEE